MLVYISTPYKHVPRHDEGKRRCDSRPRKQHPDRQEATARTALKEGDNSTASRQRSTTADVGLTLATNSGAFTLGPRLRGKVASGGSVHTTASQHTDQNKSRRVFCAQLAASVALPRHRAAHTAQLTGTPRFLQAVRQRDVRLAGRRGLVAAGRPLSSSESMKRSSYTMPSLMNVTAPSVSDAESVHNTHHATPSHLHIHGNNMRCTDAAVHRGVRQDSCSTSPLSSSYITGRVGRAVLRGCAARQLLAQRGMVEPHSRPPIATVNASVRTAYPVAPVVCVFEHAPPVHVKRQTPVARTSLGRPGCRLLQRLQQLHGAVKHALSVPPLNGLVLGHDRDGAAGQLRLQPVQQDRRGCRQCLRRFLGPPCSAGRCLLVRQRNRHRFYFCVSGRRGHVAALASHAGSGAAVRLHARGRV